MNIKIKHPGIAVKLSIKAYQNAAKAFNEQQEKDFQNRKKDLKVKTVKSLLLKEEHHQVFYTIINYYKEKLENLNALFQGSPSITTHIAPNASMMLTTGRLAKHLQRANNTIRARLKRLEKAGIVTVIFHGHKKPLEIIFNKEICIIYDKGNPDYQPSSKFLDSSDTDFYGIKSIKAQNKESTFSGTYNNITITERDVLPDESSTLSESYEKIESRQELKNPSSGQNNCIHTEKNPGTTEKAGTTKTENQEKRKKVPQKKEKRSPEKSLIDKKIEALKEKKKFDALTTEQKKTYYKIEREKELKRRKEEALKHYSYEFYAYLIANLFPDKYLAPHYRQETLDYISEHYFSKALTITTMDAWLKEYKKRIDISKK